MQVSPVESLPQVERLVTEVPILERFMTLPDVEKNLPGFKRAFGIGNQEEPEPSSLVEPPAPIGSSATIAVVEDGNEAQKADQADINRLARMVAEKRLGRKYTKGDKEYGPAVRRAMFDAKDMCGIPYKKPKDYSLEDVANLTRYLERELKTYD